MTNNSPKRADCFAVARRLRFVLVEETEESEVVRSSSGFNVIAQCRPQPAGRVFPHFCSIAAAPYTSLPLPFSTLTTAYSPPSWLRIARNRHI